LARELGRSLPAIVVCEDEWISALGFEIRSLEDYLDASGRFQKVIGSLVPDLLRHGVSVVLDFAANTVRRRAWVRSLFEAAGADHVLYWIEASDAECLSNIHRRNDEKPPGSTGARSRTSCSTPSTRTSSPHHHRRDFR
jgi:predicted kinase